MRDKVWPHRIELDHTFRRSLDYVDGADRGLIISLRELTPCFSVPLGSLFGIRSEARCGRANSGTSP